MARYNPKDLATWSADLLRAAGLDGGQADIVSGILVEGDLLGHDTHGLQLLPAYLQELLDGRMIQSGAPETIADHGAIAVWDGHWLSGVWLTDQALRLAESKADTFGTGIVVVRRSHHVACLQAYLLERASRGYMVMIASSDPNAGAAAPFGGIDPVFSPNPIALGIPTQHEPILIDMSSSITTLGMASRAIANGDLMNGKWLQDGEGNPTADPNVLRADTPGTLLLAGGHDHGHKGYGWAIMVEALTQALSGYGRFSHEKRWGACVHVQVTNPSKFAGLDAFKAQTSHLASLCASSRPHPAHQAVRMPGQRALERRRQALKNGLELADDLLPKLEPFAKRWNLAAPAALSSQ